MTYQTKLGPVITTCVITSLLAACGGSDDPGAPAAVAEVPAAPPVVPAALTCNDSIKTGFKPDANTTVLLVKAFKAGDPLVLSEAPTATTRTATRDLCVVKLNVGPGNPGPANALSTSPGIGIEIWLPAPANWNGRIHAKGNGGWAGGVQGSTTTLAGTGNDTSSNLASTAMEEGAVSGSTDTGHANTANSGSFAMNPDGTINTALWKDYSERSIHELAQKLKDLTQAYYGKAATYTYWNGFSTGGRQGLKAAQVYPGDFDGILAGAPAINWTRFSTAHMAPQIVMERDLGGVRLTAAQQSLVSNAAINACDVVGGQHLGYVPEPSACQYDPTVDAAVLCTADGGTNASSACVTSAQASAFNKIWYGQTDDGTVPAPAVDNGAAVILASKQRWFGPPRGSDLSNFLGGPLSNSSAYVALELQNPAFALPNFVNGTGNGANLWRTFTYAQLANAADRGLALQGAFANIDTDNADLSAYRDRKGKVLMYHGQADSLIKPAGSTHYYNRVASQMGGLASIQSFYRFYLVPAMFHGFSNGSANPTANPPLPTNAQLYEALTNGVEKGIAPERLDIASAMTTANPVQKTFPLCVYPLKSTFVGGDAKLTASYVCR